VKIGLIMQALDFLTPAQFREFLEKPIQERQRILTLIIKKEKLK